VGSQQVPHPYRSFGVKPVCLAISSEDARAQFLLVMKGEGEVRPIRVRERAVRTRLTLDHPADSLEGGKNPPCFSAGQLLTPPGT
jgi:hypothetical protein